MAKTKKPRTKEYAVNVVYSMVHTVYVRARDKEEAKDKARNAFIYGNEDLSGDEMDGIERTNVVEWWPGEKESQNGKVQ